MLTVLIAGLTVLIVVPITYATCKSIKHALNEVFDIDEPPPEGKRYCINCKYLSEPGKYVIQKTQQPVQACLVFHQDHTSFNGNFDCKHYEHKIKSSTNTSRPI